MGKRVSVSVDNYVAEVVLDRAEKHNALDIGTFEQLVATGRELALDRSLRAVVLRGDGDNFSAGIDISMFDAAGSGISADALSPQDGSIANFYQRAGYVWQELPVPVICAIRGICFGGGLQLALGADIRFAAPGAQLSIMEIKWGLVPDMAITATARDIVRLDHLKELAFTGRIVDGAEAARLGLVTAVADDPVAKAREVAAAIAQRSPDAIRSMKRLFNDGLREPLAASLRREAALQLQLLKGGNQREAALANLERRTPDFADASIDESAAG